MNPFKLLMREYRNPSSRLYESTVHPQGLKDVRAAVAGLKGEQELGEGFDWLLSGARHGDAGNVLEAEVARGAGAPNFFGRNMPTELVENMPIKALEDHRLAQVDKADAEKLMSLRNALIADLFLNNRRRKLEVFQLGDPAGMFFHDDKTLGLAPDAPTKNLVHEVTHSLDSGMGVGRLMPELDDAHPPVSKNMSELMRTMRGEKGDTSYWSKVRQDLDERTLGMEWDYPAIAEFENNVEWSNIQGLGIDEALAQFLSLPYNKEAVQRYIQGSPNIQHQDLQAKLIRALLEPVYTPSAIENPSPIYKEGWPSLWKEDVPL